jgi:hypothetical protein
MSRHFLKEEGQIKNPTDFTTVEKSLPIMYYELSTSQKYLIYPCFPGSLFRPPRPTMRLFCCRLFALFALQGGHIL